MKGGNTHYLLNSKQQVTLQVMKPLILISGAAADVIAKPRSPSNIKRATNLNLDDFILFYQTTLWDRGNEKLSPNLVRLDFGTRFDKFLSSMILFTLI